MSGIHKLLAKSAHLSGIRIKFRNPFTFTESVSLDSNDLQTPNCEPIEWTVWPRKKTRSYFLEKLQLLNFQDKINGLKAMLICRPVYGWYFLTKFSHFEKTWNSNTFCVTNNLSLFHFEACLPFDKRNELRWGTLAFSDPNYIDKSLKLNIDTSIDGSSDHLLSVK